MFALALHCKFKCVPHATFNTEPSVHRSLRCHLIRGSLSKHTAFTDVWSFGVFADHHEVMRTAVAGSSTDKWSLVHIKVEFEPHLQQQTSLDDSGRNPRVTDCSKKDRIEGT